MSVAQLCEALINPKNLHSKNISLGIEVLTTTANGPAELHVNTQSKTLIDDVPVFYYKRWTKDHTHFSPALLWSLRKKILLHIRENKHKKGLVIHIHAWWNLVSILSCWIGKWYNIPVVLSPRGMLTPYTMGSRNSWSKKWIHIILGEKLLKFCHIHATSEMEKTNILEFTNPKSITVIPNLVNFPKHVPLAQADLKDMPFKLIYLSRIEEKKGLELAFEALAQLNISWELTIAGIGEEKYVQFLKGKAKKLGISSRVDWIGYASNENKFNLLAGHDLMLLTSYNENFANVVIESLSVGTPVLLSKQVGLADYVVEKKLGWLTDLDATSIARKFNEAYINKNNRDLIRSRAPKLIHEDFNDEILVQHYTELYKNVTEDI